MEPAPAQRRRSSTCERLKPAPSYTHPVTFHYEIQNHTTRMQKLTHAFRVYRLMALTVICVITGILIGLWCRPYTDNWTERHFMYIEFPGELYLRFLKLLIIPLLVSNVILSFGTIQGKICSRLGKVAGGLYLMSNLIAITVAILCAVIIRPGGPHRHLHLGPEAKAADAHIHILDEQMQNHHILHQYHDSIVRYRDYHPMYYHSNRDESTPTLCDPTRVVRDGASLEISKVFSMIGNISNNGIKIREAEVKPRQNNSQAQSNDELQNRMKFGVIRNEETIMIDVLNETNLLTDFDGGDSFEDILITSGEFANLIRSVKGNQDVIKEINRIGLSTKLPIDVVLDVLRNLMPDSIIGATLQQSRTRLFTPKELRIEKNGSTEPSPNRWPMGHEMVDQPNIIGLLAMSVLTGTVLSHMGEASRPMLDLCSCASELSLRIGIKAIHFAPFCIMFLLIGQVARARDLSSIAGELFMYSLTVVTALIVHGFVILPSLYFIITKKSPFNFFKGLLEALVASFATSSSSSTMALMLDCLTGLNLNLVIVRAFGPLGSVFNMNGTSIFEAVAVIFIAQTLGVELPLTSLLLVGLCSAVASLSTSGIPSSGMMTMVIVLNSINLPVLELSLIYIVDFIIDRFRTVVNVWSGAIVCGVIDHVCPEELFEEEMKPEKYREMIKYRASRGSLSGRKSLATVEDKPQVISVTITPPPESSRI